MTNGITWNGKDLVLVADTNGRGLNEYNGLVFNRFINV